MSKSRGLAILFFLAVTAALAHPLSYGLYSNKTLDTAMLLDAINSVAKTGDPKTEMLASSAEAHATWTMPPEMVCEAPLKPLVRADTGTEVNVLKNHAYYLIFVFGFLAKFFNPMGLMAFLHCLFFIAMPFAGFLFLRHYKFGWVASSLVAFLIVAHPAWFHSLQGNLYMDRFFMPLALCLFLYLFRQIDKREGLSLLVVAGLSLLAGATNDRSLIVLILGLGMTLVLFFFQLSWRSRLTLVLVISSLMAGLGTYLLGVKDLTALGQSAGGYGSFATIFSGFHNFWRSLTPDYVSQQVGPYLMINLVFFGSLILLSGRWMLIAFVMLLPNLLISIGGAEKTGFYTHYHSQYFPFLVFAVIVGFVWGARRRPILSRVLLVASCWLVLNEAPRQGTVGAHGTLGQFKNELVNFYFDFEKSNYRKDFEVWSEFRKKVPPGASVATVEAATVPLYDQNQLYYFPMNMDFVDWIILPGDRDSSPFVISGAVSYIGQEKQINQCLLERMTRNGYRLDYEKSSQRMLFFSKTPTTPES